MASFTECSVDQFASTLKSLFGSIEKEGTSALLDGIKAGAETSKDKWKSAAPKNTGEYSKSIRYRVDRTGEKPQATVYSTKPGLPHLLEKGHAKMGGGYVAARVHIAPAAEDGFEKAMQAFENGLAAKGL